MVARMEQNVDVPPPSLELREGELYEEATSPRPRPDAGGDGRGWARISDARRP